MSAYKTAFIRLGEAEYKRLREAEEQLRLNNLLDSNAKKGSGSNEHSIYENMLGIKKENDKKFQNLVVDLEGEICRIEKEASDWVENQANQIHMEFQNYRSSVQQQASDQLDEMVKRANQQIQQKEDAFNTFWQAHEERISSFENRWQEYETQALNWIQKNQDILDFLYDNYLIDAQTSNQLELQRQYLNQIIQQYNNGFFDIAASAGFQIFIALSNIRFQLDVERTLQGIQYQNLINTAVQLQDSIHESHTVHAMDGEGNELPEMINVDYWVEGRYLEFSRRAELVIQSIFADENIDFNRIATFKTKLGELSNELIDLVTQARLVVLASQLRFNVAQIVVQALEEQGFFLELAHYEKDDFRESFVAKTCNFAGNEVLVCIDPEPGLDEGGKLHIRSLDANQITEHELLQRNYEIFSAIKENGVDVGDIQEVRQVPEGKVQVIDRTNKIFRNNQVALEDKLINGRH